MTLVGRRALLAGPALLAGRARAGEEAVLAVGVVADPVTLDPAYAGSFFENQVLYNLHETLLVARPDGSLEPGLAERWGSPDPLTWSLSLRPGLSFHDGSPVDAAAVRDNIRRYTDPATGSIRRADYGPFAGVVATGKLEVTIRLSEPYAPLPQVLANRAGMMISPASFAPPGAGSAGHAVGCGAYRLVSWTKNAELVAEKFPGYWRGDGHGFARLSFRPIADETVRLLNLRSGTLHLIDAVPPQSVPALQREPGVRVAQMPSLGFAAFSLNCTRPPFADRRVRQAFAAAIDPALVHRIVYFGTGRIAHGPLSPAIGWAFDPDFAPSLYDPVRARLLLDAAGVAVPLAVTLTVTNSPQMVRAAQLIQAEAEVAGFAVSIRQIDATSLLAVLQQHAFEACMSPWSGRYDPDGNTFFWFTRGAPANFAGYDSAAMDALLRRARSIPDRAERALLYRQAQALLAEDVPVVFLHFDAVIQAGSAGVAWTQYPDGVFRLFDARPV